MRTALVGLDGSGKTTVATRLRKLHGVAVIHAIRPHDDPTSPYAELSRHLTAASAAADSVGHPQLKVALLYLQLNLYGPQERRNTVPVLVSDRHPLVDPLVYLPMYARMATTGGPGPDVGRWWAAQEPETARVVRDWLWECGGGEDIWALGTELLGLATLAGEELTRELVQRLEVDPPDQIVMLALPVEEALSRTRRRSSGTELHETTAALRAVEAAYERVLSDLATSIPVHRVDCSRRDIAQITDDVAAHLR
ncbi:hypothetical protein GCM10010172_39630 [Paractinoplanes ferrugineus]|uniref:Thymidylate kinase n=1 Tax=Paractinoplanes ferrugineus TaxID=113564 RepID=A0A919J2F6_9ACTN|nr:hypothetical protein [Actinoplanes ferrugineus]GIE12740.1 hypothetical protein Afe05nite_45800 [Actinoplanes ferrugineus]